MQRLHSKTPAPSPSAEFPVCLLRCTGFQHLLSMPTAKYGWASVTSAITQSTLLPLHSQPILSCSCSLVLLSKGLISCPAPQACLCPSYPQCVIGDSHLTARPQGPTWYYRHYTKALQLIFRVPHGAAGTTGATLRHYSPSSGSHMLAIS